MPNPTTGKVFIVGAGPGDPGLLTLRGQACLAQADVVVYDTLVNPELLVHAPQAEHVFAGKRDRRHSLPQEDINRILVTAAREGRCVVRLKGGDPFVFGRGGEEALALREAGVSYEIVPGVTAGIAVPAYAGIPVTHRGLASSVTLVSGHPADDGSLHIDIGDLPKHGTLVFYMGVKSLPAIAGALLSEGHAPGTPAALIEWGTYARQRCISANLESLSEAVDAAGVEAPAVLVVGGTVSLRETLAWFESRPLSGLRVVLTHSPGANASLESQLRALGADIFLFPTVAIEPVEPRRREEDEGESFPDLNVFNWIIFTSVNAAESVFHEMDRLGLDARHLARAHLCATGETTVETLRKRFLKADAQPEGHGAASMLETLRAHPNAPLGKGSLIFLPRADIAPSELAKALREAGAMVIEHVAYRTAAPAKAVDEVDALLDFAPEAVLFTSPVALRNFSALLGAARLAALGDCAYGSIGPVTSAAAGEAGLEITIEPGHYAVRHLVEALCAWRAAAPS